MNPKVLKRLNGIAVLVWTALILPTVLLWHSSILWVALMSVWANVVSHYTAWVSSRAEVASNENPPQKDAT